MDDVLRLIDFGLSQRVRGGQAIAGQAGSIPYMAPEISTRMYDYKVDIWSIGVILYTLLQGKLPFDGRTAQEIMNRAATKEPNMEGVHNAVADFLKWCVIACHEDLLLLACSLSVYILYAVVVLMPTVIPTATYRHQKGWTRNERLRTLAFRSLLDSTNGAFLPL